MSKNKSDDSFQINWLAPENDNIELEHTTSKRLPIVIEIHQLEESGVYKAATIKEIYEVLESKFGCSKIQTRVWLHWFTKWGWLWRPFKGGYRLTKKASVWIDENLEDSTNAKMS
jgi:hypothetical protein